MQNQDITRSSVSQKYIVNWLTDYSKDNEILKALL